MELQQLRSFRMIAEYKSFSKAAAELHLTQPALTVQIKRLEEELGELLIERLGRTVALTPAGEVFYGFAQQILNLTETARETMRQFSTSRGRLAIGAGTTNTIFRLPLILQQFHQSYPRIELRIRNGDSELVTKLVYENSIDLGLVTTRPKAPLLQFLTVIPIFEDPIWLVGPTGYPESLSAEALQSEPLVLFRSGSGFRRFLETQFQSYGFKPQVALELESMEAIIRLVQSGLGLAFLPEVAVREELQLQKLRRITIAGWRPMVRQTDLIYRRDKYLTWPVRAFLRQALGENWQDPAE
jgi:DNA-binding transcriptional LysR family regulator